MSNVTRSYGVKDVDMILAADTIVGHAIANKAFLQSKRSTWADPFFEDFRDRIENAIQLYLGADNAKELRNATQKVYSILAPVKRVMAEIKVQIEEDFKRNPERRDEILNTLGFTDVKSVRDGDQEATVKFLQRFKSNLTAELKNELVGKGIMGSTLEEVITHAEKFKDASVSQEMNKGTRKIATAEGITEFNEIYLQLASINRIATKFYKDDKPRQALFNFSQTAKAMRNFRKEKTDAA